MRSASGFCMAGTYPTHTHLRKNMNMYTRTCHANTHMQTAVKRKIFNFGSNVISSQSKLCRVHTELPREKMYALLPLSHGQTGIFNFLLFFLASMLQIALIIKTDCMFKTVAIAFFLTTCLLTACLLQETAVFHSPLDSFCTRLKVTALKWGSLWGGHVAHMFCAGS